MRNGFSVDIQHLLGQNIDSSYTPPERVRGRKQKAVAEFLADKIKCGPKCPLFEHAQTPQMKPYGLGKKKIAIVGIAPERVDDRRGKPFRGKNGVILKNALAVWDVSLDRDTKIFNFIQCRPCNPAVDEDDEMPDDFIVSTCISQRLEKQLDKYKPRLIIACGEEVYKRLIDQADARYVKINDFQTARRLVFYSKRWGCNIGVIPHPSYVTEFNRDRSAEFIFRIEVGHVLKIGFETYPTVEESSGNQLITNYKKLCDLLNKWIKNKNLKSFSFDYETEGLSPYARDAKIYTMSVAFSKDKGYAFPIEFPSQGDWVAWTPSQLKNIKSLAKQLLDHPVEKSAQNKGFEIQWSVLHIGIWPRNLNLDTMHIAHAIDERRGLAGLKTQVYLMSGSIYDRDVDKKNILAQPLKDVLRYNSLDSRYTKNLEEWQTIHLGPGLKRAIPLQEKVIDVFTRMSLRGLQLDLSEMVRQREAAMNRIDVLQREYLNLYDKAFYRKQKTKLNVNSTKDLAILLYEVIGIIPSDESKTAAGNYSVAKDILVELAAREKQKNSEVGEFINGLLEFRNLDKMVGTYLDGWLTLADSAGVLHPSFALLTRTLRSNSFNPNFQNVPKRNSNQKEVRRCIIPKHDFFLEGDGKAMEVVVMAMMSGDAELTRQIKKRIDPHARWGGRLFEKKPEDVTSEERGDSKNALVFPRFYGSNERGIHRDLVSRGYDVTMNHVIKVLREMESEYKELFAWQRKLQKDYNRTGRVEMPTGFQRHGPLEINKIINTPIQHSATWILFAGMVYVDEILVGEKFDSGLNIEVHDAFTIDSTDKELDDVFDIAHREFTKNRFKWMHDVPVAIDWSLGEDWYEMSTLKAG